MGVTDSSRPPHSVGATVSRIRLWELERLREVVVRRLYFVVNLSDALPRVKELPVRSSGFSLDSAGRFRAVDRIFAQAVDPLTPPGT